MNFAYGKNDHESLTDSHYSPATMAKQDQESTRQSDDWTKSITQIRDVLKSELAWMNSRRCITLVCYGIVVLFTFSLLRLGLYKNITISAEWGENCDLGVKVWNVNGESWLGRVIEGSNCDVIYNYNQTPSLVCQVTPSDLNRDINSSPNTFCLRLHNEEGQQATVALGQTKEAVIVETCGVLFLNDRFKHIPIFTGNCLEVNSIYELGIIEG